MDEKKQVILIIDDSEINRALLNHLLMGEYSILLANDGYQGVEMALKHLPDLILLDILMPNIDGYETIKIIKNNELISKIPVVFISGLDSVEDERIGLDLGATDYISRPFAPPIVIARIRNILISVKQRDLVEKQTKELKEAYESLKHSQNQLIEAEKFIYLGELVAGVAHELNTPIGIGVTTASHLRDVTNKISDAFSNNTLKKSKFDHYVKSINDSSNLILSSLQRSSELIKSFKLVAADQGLSEKKSFNLNDYLNSILTVLNPEIKKSGHIVNVKCPEQLCITNYPGAFSSIIANFFMNSQKHAYKDRTKGEMNIIVSEEDQDVVLIFKDNGQGITSALEKKIFEPFFTTKRNEGRAGLGLHIVYNTVVNILKGNIRCEGNPGKGAQFIIRFPNKI
ncbi:MAG: hybrid sensor histidine kinase/response regulator [Nitrospinae bacterium]|nr:hybrid sensor histidine kinase/response regulator [Nitrospinota bacterium]